MTDDEPELAYARQHVAELNKWISLGEDHGIDMTDGKMFRAYVLDMIVSCQLASTVYGAGEKGGMMNNCDICEHHTVEGKTTHYYGCKYGWKSCRVCPECDGSGAASYNVGTPVESYCFPCPVCHGRGTVEKKEKTV